MNLEDLVLSTLSFYEPMNLSKIIFDMDQKVLEGLPEFDQKELDRILLALEKKKHIKKMKMSGEFYWIRVFKKQSFFNRLRRLLLH